MDPELKIAICRAVGKEPFAKALNLNLIELELGRSVVAGAGILGARPRQS